MSKCKLWFILFMLAAITWLATPVSADTNTSISVNTNGFDSYVLVRVNASDVSEILHSGLNISYSNIENNIVFLASDNQRYDIITNNPVNLTDGIEVTLESTMYINTDFDGQGVTYKRGAGIALGEWVICINGDNITVTNFRLDASFYIDTVADLAVCADNVELSYVEIFNSTKYTFTTFNSTGLNMHHCKVYRGQYGFSGSGVLSYDGWVHDNYFVNLTRNAVKVKGLNNYTFTNNLFLLNQPYTTLPATVYGIDISRDYGSQNVTFINNTMFKTRWYSDPSAGIYAGNNPPLAGNNISGIVLENTVMINLLRAGWIVNDADYLTITNTTLINCTLGFTDNDGGNTITGTVTTDKEYYNVNPPIAGSKGKEIRVINLYNATGLGGEGRYYGLYPSVLTKIKIDVGWADAIDGVYVYVGGFRIKCYTYAGGVRILAYDENGAIIDCADPDNVSRAYFEVDINTRDRTAIFTWPGDEDEGAFGLPFTFYYNKFNDVTANIFTSPEVVITDIAAATGTLYGLQQYVYCPDFASSIGSIRHQGVGWDGPRTWAENGNGLFDISNLGGNCTIFWDTGSLGNGTYNTWINSLNFETGIHYHPVDLTSISNTEFEGNVTDQTAVIVALTGNVPSTYTVLGVGWLTNESRTQYMINTEGIILRANRVNTQSPSSFQLIDSNFAWIDNATTLGYAVAPLYGHETEITPADAGSINAEYWDTWISHLQVGEGTKVVLVGFYEWYMINSNQYSNDEATDATFSYITGLYSGDLIDPTASTPVHSTTLAGATCSFSSSLADETGLSHYIFSFFNGTAYVNGSAIAIGGGVSHNMVVVRVLNGTVGSTIHGLVYVNDTSDNWGISGELTFLTTAPPAATAADELGLLVDTITGFLVICAIIPIITTAVLILNMVNGGEVNLNMIMGALGVTVGVVLTILFWVKITAGY